MSSSSILLHQVITNHEEPNLLTSYQTSGNHLTSTSGTRMRLRHFPLRRPTCNSMRRLPTSQSLFVRSPRIARCVDSFPIVATEAEQRGISATLLWSWRPRSEFTQTREQREKASISRALQRPTARTGRKVLAANSVKLRGGRAANLTSRRSSAFHPLQVPDRRYICRSRPSRSGANRNNFSFSSPSSCLGVREDDRHLWREAVQLVMDTDPTAHTHVPHASSFRRSSCPTG